MANKSVALNVKEIFETMEYGSVKENLDLAQVWMQKTDLTLPKTDEEVESIFKKHEKLLKDWNTVSNFKKFFILNKLAEEIEKNSNLLCQLELISRKILVKDSKTKSIPILIDYIKYYANWWHLIKLNYSKYKAYGVCGSFLAPNTPLSIFGLILSPALISGNTIIFAVSSTFIPVACLIKELCNKVGLPEGLVSFIESDNLNFFFTHSRIEKITYVGNLYEKTFTDLVPSSNISLTTLHLGKASCIVFDSADIDSACDTIIENAWSLGGLFPYGISQIYVQETISTSFMDKFKSKIEKLKVEYFDKFTEKTCDILIKEENFINQDSKQIITNKLPINFNYKLFGNEIDFEDNSTNILSIIPFRTAGEVINLANNSKFGLATSVWTENISLVKEVTLKLATGIIWINTYGNINTNASFTPYKKCGNGYFGGKEGLLEYLTLNERNKYLEFNDTDSSIKKDINNHIENTKKSFNMWNKLDEKSRMKCLQNLAKLCTSMKVENAIVKKWIEYLYEWTVPFHSETFSQQGNPDIEVKKEPLGIVTINTYNDENLSCLKLIIGAVALGNTVIVINCSLKMQEFFEDLSKVLPSSGIPSGTISCLNTNLDTVLKHREIQSYFCSFSFNCLNHQQVPYLKNIDNINISDHKQIVNYFTKNKCIYTSVGESFL